MAVSRREFVRRLGIGGAGLASASLFVAREDLLAFGRPDQAAAALQAVTAPIKLDANENMRGPSPKVIDALKRHPSAELGLGYPVPMRTAFTETIAAKYGARPENVILGAASGAILQAGVRAFVTSSRPLVTGDPSYGSPAQTARRMGAAVKAVPVDSALRLDLDAMVEAANGAGLVFLCNPNNPTSTIHTLADVERAVRAIKDRSPETAILIDEAYIDYATAPGVGTGAKLALELPGVFMTRTFSKAYGLAGLRMGYAIGQPETLEKVEQAWGLGSINELQSVAGIEALKDTAHMERERQENKRVRDWTLAQFKEMGFEAPDSQTNFVFVNIGRPAAGFREGCEKRGVLVGRDFPPLEKTHARISLGTMDQMQRAMPVFRQVLGQATSQ